MESLLRRSFVGMVFLDLFDNAHKNGTVTVKPHVEVNIYRNSTQQPKKPIQPPNNQLASIPKQ